MSFIGAIRAGVRPIIADYAKSIQHPVVLVGAGNFTIPAVLRKAGYTGDLTACDVSVYSSALGSYLAGIPFDAREKTDCPDHMKGFLLTGARDDLIASTLMLFDLREVWQSKNPYQQRIVEQYRCHWPELIQKTKTKLAEFKNQIGLIRYEAKDGFQLLRELDPRHTIMTAPPTYKRGYERLEKLYSAIIEWTPPDYEDMTDKTTALYELIAKFDDYLIVQEKELPEAYEIIGEPNSIAHSGRNTKIYVIKKQRPKSHLMRGNAPSAPIGNIWPPEKKITGAETLTMAFLTSRQTIRLNELYLSAHVDYTTQGSSVSFGFFLDGLIIGKSDFCRSTQRWALPDEKEMIYLMSDLAVPSNQKRLSKLILLALLSRDVWEQLRQRYIEAFGWVGTTAFSRKPVSMKYRGIFKLHKRKEVPDGYSLNYYAPFAEHALSDVVRIWLTKYGR